MRKIKNKNLNEQPKLKKSFIFYLITFIPYCILIPVAFFGTTFIFNKIYGFDAVVLMALAFCIIPVFPILLLFQLIYTIKNRKKFSKKQKNITICFISIILALIFAPCIFYEVKDQIQINNEYKENIPQIEKYLSDNFGEYSKDMKILKPSAVFSDYLVETPLLDKQCFTIFIYKDEINDNFKASYVEENNIKEKASDYLVKKYNFNKDISVEFNNIDFDLKYLENKEELIKNAKYTISYLTINKNNYNQEEIINVIKELYSNKELQKELKINMIFVTINNTDYALITIDKKELENNILTLNFSGYTNSKGRTIEDEQIIINLDKN